VSRVGESIHHPYGESLGIGGADDGTKRQLGADEFGGDSEDQIGLQLRITGGVEVGEGEAVGRIGERSDGWLYSISREVNPLQEVHHFVSADAEKDLKDLEVSGFLSEYWIETGSGLFDHAEVKGCRVGDGLNVVGGSEIVVVARNGRQVDEIDGLRKGCDNGCTNWCRR